jgi:hypothetical protein
MMMPRSVKPLYSRINVRCHHGQARSADAADGAVRSVVLGQL